jgi:ABC-type antimicrobial peptide transport system permease subunit
VAQVNSRLVVKVKNPADTRISDYFAQKSYVANEQNMRIAQTGGIVQIIMAVLGGVGFVFMLLAFVVMVLQFNVVLAEAKPEIILLLQIGYLPNQILRFLGQQIAVFLGVVFVCVAIMVYGVGEYANGILQTRGLGLQNGVSMWIFGLEFLLILMLFLLQMWQTKRIMDYKFVSV